MENLKELKDLTLHSGTTTIGIVCKDGIILAADKRMSLGQGWVAHKKAEKVLKITDKIAVTTAGVVSDIQLLVKLTKAELKLKQLKSHEPISVKETANLFAMLTYQNIRKFSPVIGVTAFLVGGIDEKGYWLYEISPDGSVVEHKDFVSTGSGMVVAYGVLEDAYNKDLTIEEGIKIAVRALNAAMQRDVFSGSGIDVMAITPEGARKVVEEEVKQILVSEKQKPLLKKK